MALYLILSSIAAGLIATFVMMIFLYLPILWNGNFYDVLGAIGSLITKQVDARSRFIGGLIYIAFGIVFSVLYGLILLPILQAVNAGNMEVPQLIIFSGMPVEINLFYVILGLIAGIGHGIIVSLFATIIIIEHHPLEQFRSRYILVLSQLISHIAFGATVMFFHSQFLQLLMNLNT